VRSDSAAARKVTELLAFAGIAVNGCEPWDIQVHDERFFERALAEGSIGVGESYMDGWWDVPVAEVAESPGVHDPRTEHERGMARRRWHV